MAKSAAPLLLVAGAAFLLMGGKKKKRGSSRAAVNSYGELPHNSPLPLPAETKVSGSGYSNVTRERMQWIQTSLAALGYDVGSNGMDGRYSADTKAAVWEFQTDHEDVLGNPDGKPGKNTQAMLEQALAGRGEAQSQGQVPQDECDPLDPSTWGIGNMCVIESGRWVRVPAAAPPTGQPDPSSTSRERKDYKTGSYNGDSGYAYGWYAQEYSSAPLWEWEIKRIPPVDDVLEFLFEEGCYSKADVVGTIEYIRELLASGETNEEGALLRLSGHCAGLNGKDLRHLLENAPSFDGYKASGTADSYLNAWWPGISDAIYESETSLKG